MAGKRMLHKNICTSDKISELSWFQEVLYYRILVSADDHGWFFFAEATIADLCFPGKKISTKTLREGRKKLVDVGLLAVKFHNKRKILAVKDWEKYQFLRKDRGKHSFFGIPKDMPVDRRPEIPEVKDQVKDKDKGQGNGSHDPNFFLINQWELLNPKLLEAYPKFLSLADAEISAARNRGWSVAEVEAKLKETAGKGVKPWDLFKERTSKPPVFKAGKDDPGIPMPADTKEITKILGEHGIDLGKVVKAI